MDARDTIAAVSSAVGVGARMIVRVSGGAAHGIARELASVGDIAPGAAGFCRIWPGVMGWVYWFVGPRSYTGEDRVEFQVPGSPVLGRMLLEQIVQRGARLAE